MAGNISFRDAASKFSMDDNTKRNGGEVLNSQSGSTYFEIDQLDPDVYYAIEKLKPGEISEAISFTDYQGKRSAIYFTQQSKSTTSGKPY